MLYTENSKIQGPIDYKEVGSMSEYLVVFKVR
jgi:hypothetical protein